MSLGCAAAGRRGAGAAGAQAGHIWQEQRAGAAAGKHGVGASAVVSVGVVALGKPVAAVKCSWAHIVLTSCVRHPRVQAAEAWEQRVVRYGQGQLGALEEHVARIGRENLQVRSCCF